MPKRWFTEANDPDFREAESPGGRVWDVRRQYSIGEQTFLSGGGSMADSRSMRRYGCGSWNGRTHD
jgi:hypothetical protein